MSSLSLRNKLLLLALLPLLTVSIVLMLASWTVESDALESEITNFREKLLNERRQELVHVTEVAKEIVSFQRSQGGDYKAALRDVRFGSAGYFFVYDGKGKNLFHALLPKLEGTDQIGMTDPKGTKIIVAC